MNKDVLLFDAAKAYGRILASEVRVTQKDKINNLIERKINRSPWFFFSVIKTRREYENVKITELVENENVFTNNEKRIVWDGIFESIQYSTTAVRNINPFSTEEVKRLDSTSLVRDTLFTHSGIQCTHLGSGAFGVVEKVKWKDGNFVARKTLKLTEDESINSQLKRRFKREVQYQAEFDHLNIVKVLESDLDCDVPYFTMPLAICSLGNESDHGISLSQKDNIIISRMIIEGIRVIHDSGQMHRDIKPQNVLRFHHSDGHDYDYAISDFGLVADRSRENTTALTMTSVPLGTMAYISPECYLDAKNNSSFQSDIYSLGVLIKFIFDGETGLPMNKRQSNSIFKELIMKCTEPQPADRYSSIDELKSDFENICDELD
ncbi:serine/threonine protein kinase [Vibrio vulnificus]|uniref:serine/threonine-protein kinase n=1 Tax=Vibrio vulnificus TaxID=672 RepID=UPI0012ADBF68|nr:serine/threonine-protein kinase [Vibrio vulnificus]EIF5019350.1 serine/threonine protein kinase [Vibrio vulnificus]MCU8224112.1 serine/threonine protein kinase [Vibrio vulnificus]